MKPPCGCWWVALISSQETDIMAEYPFNGIRHTCFMVGGIPITETRLRYNIKWFQDEQCRL